MSLETEQNLNANMGVLILNQTVENCTHKIFHVFILSSLPPIPGCFFLHLPMSCVFSTFGLEAAVLQPLGTLAACSPSVENCSVSFLSTVHFRHHQTKFLPNSCHGDLLVMSSFSFYNLISTRAD